MRIAIITLILCAFKHYGIEPMDEWTVISILVFLIIAILQDMKELKR